MNLIVKEWTMIECCDNLNKMLLPVSDANGDPKRCGPWVTAHPAPVVALLMVEYNTSNMDVGAEKL